MVRVSTALLLCAFALPIACHAESRNPADYPLRIHVFGQEGTTFYHWRQAEETKGDGRANLFQNGEARGVDFTYDCSDRLRHSFGYSTYPAKWKKPGREIVVLVPTFGQSGSYWTCDLKVDVKDFAYAQHKGGLSSEPIEQFKAWMVKHDYDPEHGKEQPVAAAAPAGAASPSAPPADPQQ